jgi:hypothetical protein
VRQKQQHDARVTADGLRPGFFLCINEIIARELVDRLGW